MKMTNSLLLFSCLSIVQYKLVKAQCVNRQPTCNVINEAIAESPRNLISQPVTPTFSPQNALIETHCNACNSVHQVPIANVIPGPTTIITDYSPAICKNLADTLQLMTVCNLLQSSKGPSDMVLRLVSPILNEVLSSQSSSCGCKNPIYSNPILTNGITAPVLNPKVISSSFIPYFEGNAIGGSCNKGLLPNIVNILRNFV